ncbi:MAG: CoA transferase [Chloroflexi bacterium]|nr:CoA transferase [Chloroflexota bacterium]
MMATPLAGIRVLDLSRYQAGPRCGMLLADLGAEVIRVEDPIGERDGGFSGPTYQGESIYFAVYNRGKKSITLNLKHPKADRIFTELLSRADVLVENFVPGAMERLGFGYARVHAINSRLIMVSISGFGQDGPYAQMPAFCTIALAWSGYLDVSGDPNSPAHSTGVSIADRLAALNGTIGALAALYERTLSGEGQHVDVSLLDSALTMVEFPLMTYTLTGRRLQESGRNRAGSAPNYAFHARDGMIQISATRQPFWQRLALAMGQPELADDPRFDSSVKRQQPAAIAEIERIVGDWVRERTVAEAYAMLKKARVPAAPVQTLEQVVDDPQMRHRDMFPEVPHPRGGTIRVPGLSIKLSRTPGRLGPPPLRGEHNAEVYGDLLGLSSAEIKALEADRVI